MRLVAWRGALCRRLSSERSRLRRVACALELLLSDGDCLRVSKTTVCRSAPRADRLSRFSIGGVGAWGTAIFSDDTALDIRDEWRDAILDGLSTEEATARLLESFDDYLGDDEDTEKVFWMALAAAQVETGRLLP